MSSVNDQGVNSEKFSAAAAASNTASHDSSAAKNVLETNDVSIRFGGLNALDGVDLSLREGEILGVIGPNGAGKTTFINVVTGLYKPTAGRILFMGEDVTGKPAHEMGRRGLARTFQVVRPFRNLSVVENVAVGAMFGTKGSTSSSKDAFRRAEEVLERVGLAEKMRGDASKLTIPDLKRLELAKALAMRPKVLLLDEVMAGLHTGEIDDAVELLRSIHAEGITLLVIEHVMKAIIALSTRILVLEFGKKIAEGTPREVLQDERVIAAYLGDRYAARQREKEGRNA
jgi:branched-chain amino acid transport system ATP-binding protein